MGSGGKAPDWGFPLPMENGSYGCKVNSPADLTTASTLTTSDINGAQRGAN